MQVNENRLNTILQYFVETFNDCACCPLTFDCERDDEGINCYDCAEQLKEWLKEGSKKMDLIKCLNNDFANMSDEDLDELIIKAKEAKKRRSESHKLDLWRNVMRAVQDYITDFGMIEVFTEDRNLILDDDDSLKIPGEINLLG